ncbi:MAG TPA: BsuPI-related putative proteinase inhibitor [bacterium]|nr:BsuPI-related putative proteinase inhibitor [bacterium]
MPYNGVVTVQGMLIGLVLVALVAAAPGAPLMVERADGGLRHEASISKRAFDAGESIEVTITVRNAGSNPVTLTFFSGQRFDLLVRRPRGDEIWRWSHDKAFIQIVQSIPIRPNEPLTLKGSWDQRDYQGRRAVPGTYEVVAFVTGRTEGSERSSIQLPALPFTIR